MTAENTRPDEEEVLMTFAVEPLHDRATLERYIEEYPQYTQALIDCAVELMLDSARPDTELAPNETVVDQAWARFQAAMAPADAVPEVVTDPFAKVGPTLLKALVKRMDLNSLFLVRVRSRAIAAATYPQRFIQRLADELETSPKALMDFLRAPPTMEPGLSFRSVVKPEVVDQISFEAAVDSSQLGPAQKDALLNLKD